MAIMMSARDRLIKSRIQMLIHYPFFGTLAVSLKLKEFNDRTAATDGRYYYFNPKFVDGLDEQRLNFLTAHETLHPALGHLWRRGSRDAVIWNHAADYCINAMIIESDPQGKDFKMIEGGLYDPKFAGMFTEEIYDMLIKDENYVKQAHKNAGAGNPGTIDSHDQWDNPQPPDPEDADDDSNNDEDWKGRLVQAAQVAEGKGQGKTPAAIRRMIKDLIEPQKNWKELLAEFIQFELNDYGFSPPNKHHLWRDMILPDFTEVTDVVKDLVFGIDTSGSVNDKMMRSFISEVLGCMNQFGGKVRGWLVFCDAEIGAVYELEDIEYAKPVGGGGTDFRPVFRWIEENLEECAGLVYITDLMGSFPKEAPEYPTLWVSTMRDAEGPFGVTTYLDVY